MKIYISGPITGVSNFKRRFTAAAAAIRKLGHDPINPALCELPKGATWADYMRQDLKLLLGCEAVYMLRGWQKSRGAQLEHSTAQALELKIIYQREADE